MPQTERILNIQSNEPTLKVENGTTESVDFLAEIKLALQYMDENDNIPENVRRYIAVNESTRAYEATTNIIHTTFQIWDSKFKKLTGYGLKPTTEILQDGLNQARLLKRARGQKFDFEVQRREQELFDAIQLERDIASGKMDYMVKVTISAFPWGEDPKVLKEIGYFTGTRTTMLRVHEYDPDTQILTTRQIPIENSVVDFWSQVTSKFRNEYYHRSRTPSEILAAQIHLPKSRFPRAHLTLARAYDEILEQTYDKKHFLGKPIDNMNDSPDYDDLSKKSQDTQTTTERYIDELIEIDIDMAKSLKKAKPNSVIGNLIEEAYTSKDENGNFLLDSGQRASLEVTIQGGFFTLETAAILKKFSLIRTYNAIKTIVDPEQAKKLFGPEMVYRVQELHRSNSHLGLIHQEIYATSHRQSVYYFCGGMLTSGSQYISSVGINSFQLPMGEVNNMLNSGGEAKYVKNCGKCGVKIEAKISAGYKCSNCGGTYKGC